MSNIGPLFSKKSRTEIVWHHEADDFECVAVDVFVSPLSRDVVPVALFRWGKVYSIDIELQDHRKFAVEV